MKPPTKAELLYAIEKRLQADWGFESELWTDGKFIMVDGEAMVFGPAGFRFDYFEQLMEDMTACNRGLYPTAELVHGLSTEIGLRLGLAVLKDGFYVRPVAVIEKSPVGTPIVSGGRDEFEGEFGDGSVD